MFEDPSQEEAIDPALKRFLTEDQDSDIVKKIHERVTQILTSGEEILYIAVQAKPVVNINPECVVMTTRRFIIYHPRLLGQVDFEDYIWRDLQNAELKENVMGATLTLMTIEGQQLVVDYLPKAQARRLYALAQEMEEKMLEERRQRELEDKRASAGLLLGGNFAGKTPTTTPPVAPREDPVERLKQLKQMLDNGLISQAEYDSKKAEILSRM